MKMSAFPLPMAGFPNFAATQLLMSAAGGMNLQSPPCVSSPKELPNVSSATMAGLAGARIPGLPDSLSMVAAAGGHHAAGGYPQFPNMSPTAMMDPRLLIPALGGGYDMKENADAFMAWRQLAAAQAQAASAGVLSYDAHAAAMAAASFSYPSYPPMDLNGARRKNATRETTSTLKAWLYEHRKNPYPTKGEKIMLAIITKMTLTQVSTWFANARRRLKKENKMTWSPRNRTDDGSSVDDEDKPDNEDDAGLADDDDISIDLSDFETENNSSPQKQSISCNTARVSPQRERETAQRERETAPIPPTQSPVSPPKDTNTTSSGSHKPRIWSIAEVAASKPVTTQNVNPIHHQSTSVRHRPYPIPNPTAFRPFFDNSYRQFAGHPALGAVAALSNPLLACRPPVAGPLRVPHLSPSLSESAMTSLHSNVRTSSSSSTNTTSAEKTISKLETIAKRMHAQDRSSPSHSSSSRSGSEH